MTPIEIYFHVVRLSRNWSPQSGKKLERQANEACSHCTLRPSGVCHESVATASLDCQVLTYKNIDRSEWKPSTRLYDPKSSTIKLWV